MIASQLYEGTRATRHNKIVISAINISANVRRMEEIIQAFMFNRFPLVDTRMEQPEEDSPSPPEPLSTEVVEDLTHIACMKIASLHFRY